jgi:hypothetical protein
VPTQPGSGASSNSATATGHSSGACITTTIDPIIAKLGINNEKSFLTEVDMKIEDPYTIE